MAGLPSQGTYINRLVFGGDAGLADLGTWPPNLKSFIETLSGLSQVYCPHGLSTTSLSQGWVLRAASGSGKTSRRTFQG